MTSTDPTFQAHELVYCAQCFLPYDQDVNITELIDIPPDSAKRSWYLTNCGHAVCSKCLFPDGSIFPGISTNSAPPSTENEKFPCPRCAYSASVVGLAAEVLPLSTVIRIGSDE